MDAKDKGFTTLMLKLTIQIVGERKKTLVYGGDDKANVEKFEYL